MSMSASGLDFSPWINVAVYGLFKYDNLYIQLCILFQWHLFLGCCEVSVLWCVLFLGLVDVTRKHGTHCMLWMNPTNIHLLLWNVHKQCNMLRCETIVILTSKTYACVITYRRNTWIRLGANYTTIVFMPLIYITSHEFSIYYKCA